MEHEDFFYKLEFGRYPKAKYEIFGGKTFIYSFVTTIHSEEESIKLIKEKINEGSWYNVIRIYKTVRGERILIHQCKVRPTGYIQLKREVLKREAIELCEAYGIPMKEFLKKRKAKEVVHKSHIPLLKKQFCYDMVKKYQVTQTQLAKFFNIRSSTMNSYLAEIKKAS